MTDICFSFAEVTTINRSGFWVQWGEEELYLSFAEFPWFENATVRQICTVKCATSNRLYWPELDLDLPLDAIRYPMAFSHNGLSYDC
ncbi:MAG: DUF2442 domain-containing protein [Gammaproteobacteria bacterium]